MEKQWITWFSKDCPSLVQDSVNHYAATLPHRNEVSMGELADFLEKDTLYICVHGSDYVHVISSTTQQPVAKLQWQYPPAKERTVESPTTPADFADAVEKLMGQAPETLQVICYVADVDTDEQELKARASKGLTTIFIFELLDHNPELVPEVKRLLANWEGYQAKLTQLKEQTA